MPSFNTPLDDNRLTASLIVKRLPAVARQRLVRSTTPCEYVQCFSSLIYVNPKSNFDAVPRLRIHKEALASQGGGGGRGKFAAEERLFILAF